MTFRMTRKCGPQSDNPGRLPGARLERSANSRRKHIPALPRPACWNVGFDLRCL